MDLRSFSFNSSRSFGKPSVLMFAFTSQFRYSSGFRSGAYFGKYTAALRLFPVQWAVEDSDYTSDSGEHLSGRRRWDLLPLGFGWTQSNGNTCANAPATSGITGSPAAC